MSRETPAIDDALPALRALLADAGARYKLVGGVAVVHHGYARMTDDIDVLVDPASLPAIDARSSAYGFTRASGSRLVHGRTGVRVDLLVAGAPGPRPGDPPYPAPDGVAASPRDAAVVDLGPLLEMKLRARRHQDLADVVALLKIVDDGRYVALEAEMPVDLRPALARLRDDALEELALDRGR